MTKLKKSGGYVSALGVIVLLTGGLQAQTTVTDPDTLARIQTGLKIAPVPLNTTGKDPNLVGLGSYFVNGSGDCNGCHSAGPATEYAPGGNPYLSQHPAVVNPKTYLGGGRDFGAFPDPTGNFPHIISRNITPDVTGLPAGGMTYDQFAAVMHTGKDPDLIHPTCTGAPDGKCIPPPFDGTLLQIMPWPTFGNMTDNDLQAIYAYLSAIPCLEGGPNERANRCTTPEPKTAAVAGPKNTTVITRQAQLDGSQSTSADGKPLQYLWTIPQGSPQAGISGATTAKPTVQFGIGRGQYTFQLTVTDSGGKTATDMVVVNFAGN